MITNCAFRTSVGHAFRRTALPLAAYYCVTLALPLANGAARAGAAFVQHAVVVLAIPPIVILLTCAIHAVVQVATRSTQPFRRSRSASSISQAAWDARGRDALCIEAGYVAAARNPATDVTA